MILYEFLLPVRSNDGSEIPDRIYKGLLGRILALAGGYTLPGKALGGWINGQGSTQVENMLPLRVACTPDQAQEIVAMIADTFPDQESLMSYVLSDQVQFTRLQSFEEHVAAKLAAKLATLGNRASQAAWDIEDALRRVRGAALEHKGEALGRLHRVTRSAQAIT